MGQALIRSYVIGLVMLVALGVRPVLAAVPPDLAPIPVSEQPSAADRRAILAMVKARQNAWNRGDFRGYMKGFENGNNRQTHLRMHNLIA